MTIPIDQVEWKTVQYLKEPLLAAPRHATWRHTLVLPRPFADWDTFDYWEVERTNDMQHRLLLGDTLIDIGTENGWQSVVYASFVGGQNMVLIEPQAAVWPNIKQTWEHNVWASPRATLCALVGNVTTGIVGGVGDVWPAPAYGEMIEGNQYAYLHDDTTGIPQFRLDDYLEQAGIIPTALTMDVEGAELRVLQGATHTLATHRPIVWVSIHPDLAERDYGVEDGAVQDFMAHGGYRAVHLATDHEQHWRFDPV